MKLYPSYVYYWRNPLRIIRFGIEVSIHKTAIDISICLLFFTVSLTIGFKSINRIKDIRPIRPIKKLLKILDREIDGEYFETGLCSLMVSLWRHDIINIDEWHSLYRYMYANNPIAMGMDKWDKNGWNKKRLGVLWWKEGAKEPLHEYLQILIND